MYEIEEYVTADGKVPFSDWLLGVKDKRAQAKVHARIRRPSLGNFGDWKPITGAKGVFEMREHYGPGYRIFYSVIGNKIVLLLIGSEKKDQDKAITKAAAYLVDYEERAKE